MDGNNPTNRTAASHHYVQFPATTGRLLDALEDYIDAGFTAGEAVIVIATASHLHALEARLQYRGHPLQALRHGNRYLPMGAEDTLARFMVDGQPDPARFATVVDELLDRAGHSGRRVRAFGEMVAVLWARGLRDAAFALEALWDATCAQRGLTLLCAYPERAFGPADDAVRARVLACHSHPWPH